MCHCFITLQWGSSWWGFSITRSVNTLLPAPWQHSWECRMFTCLETVDNKFKYLTHPSGILYICIQYINLPFEQNFNVICCFSVWNWFTELVPGRGYSLLSEAIRCCKHPTESPRCPKPQLPVKDVYSSSRLPTMEKHLRWRPKWATLLLVPTLLYTQNIFHLLLAQHCMGNKSIRAVSFPTCRLGGFRSSRGTMSIRKSNWSNFVIAMAMSFLCKRNRQRVSSDDVRL